MHPFSPSEYTHWRVTRALLSEIMLCSYALAFLLQVNNNFLSVGNGNREVNVTIALFAYLLHLSSKSNFCLWTYQLRFRWSISAPGGSLKRQCSRMRLQQWTMIILVSLYFVVMLRFAKLFTSAYYWFSKKLNTQYTQLNWLNCYRDAYTVSLWTPIQGHYPDRIATEVALNADPQLQLYSIAPFLCCQGVLCC